MGNDAGHDTVAGFADHHIGRPYEVLVVGLDLWENEEIFFLFRGACGGDKKAVAEACDLLPGQSLQPEAAKAHKNDLGGSREAKLFPRFLSVQVGGPADERDRYPLGEDIHRAGKGKRETEGCPTITTLHFPDEREKRGVICDIGPIDPIPGEIANGRGRERRAPGDLEAQWWNIAQDESDLLSLDKGEVLFDEPRDLSVQSLTGPQSLLQIHLQTVFLKDSCVDRMALVGDAAGRLLEQPFRGRSSDMDLEILRDLFETPHDLAGADCVAISVTGDVVGNWDQGSQTMCNPGELSSTLLQAIPLCWQGQLSYNALPHRKNS